MICITKELRLILLSVFQFILAIDAVVFRNTLQFIFLVWVRITLDLWHTYLCLIQHFQWSHSVIRCYPDIRSPKYISPRSNRHFLKSADNGFNNHHSHCHCLCGSGIYRARMEDLYRIWMESIQIPRCRPSHQEDVRSIPDIRVHAQVRCFFLARLFYTGKEHMTPSVFFFKWHLAQFIGLVLKHDDFEFGLTIAALPLSMLLLLQGHLAAKHESKWMMWSFLVGLVAGFAYFIYKVCLWCLILINCGHLNAHSWLQSLLGKTKKRSNQLLNH